MPGGYRWTLQEQSSLRKVGDPTHGYEEGSCQEGKEDHEEEVAASATPHMGTIVSKITTKPASWFCFLGRGAALPVYTDQALPRASLCRDLPMSRE
jgi:hypothetical protein